MTINSLTQLLNDLLTQWHNYDAESQRRDATLKSSIGNRANGK